MKKYFNQCKTKQAAKSLFRTLVMKNHPDVGGSEEIMTAIILEYRAVYDRLPNEENTNGKKQTYTQYDSDADFAMSKAMIDVLNKVNHLPDIEIELIGVWLWISGNSRPVKETIYQAGFKWHKQKSMWYWFEQDPDSKKNPHRKSNVDINVIRSVYGSEKVDKRDLEKIAQ